MKKVFKICIILVIISAIILPISGTSSQLWEGNMERNVSSVELLNYSTAPNHIYPFIYRGSEPFAFMEFDTSGCDVDCLYFYDEDKKMLEKVTEESVIAYTATKDGLYYITAGYAICYTPYDEVNTLSIGYVQGAVSSLDYFAGVLSYVEDACRIILVDVSTGEREICFTADEISSVYQFGHDKILWRDGEGNPNYLNITTEICTVLNDELEVNCLLVPYISEHSDDTRSAAGNGEMDTSFNDVMFPLVDFPATPLTYNYNYPTATSYFNSVDTGSAQCNHSSYCRSLVYGNHTQCFGFAIYAHDQYMHLFSQSKFGYQSGSNPEGWQEGDFVQCAQIINGSAIVDEEYRFSSEAKVRAFFAGLYPGAYVRYGKDDDGSPGNGAHSVVVASIEEDGVWVYECNVDNKCGVYYTYYRYDYLSLGRFDFAHNYVNHTFGEMEYVSETIHTNGCVNCDGYLRQPHTDILDPVVKDKTYHTIRYECCDHEETEEHTGSASYLPYWISQHKTYYGCCDDPYFEPHTVDGVYSYVSEEKHSVYFSCCNGLHEESHTGTSSFVCQNTRWHKKVYSCCGGSALSNHSAPAQYLRYTEDEHKVTYNCCTGFTTAPHTYTSGTNPVCTGCGKPKIEGLRKNAVVVDLELVEAQGE